MPTYVTLSNFTEQGMKNIKDTAKRAEAFKKAGVEIPSYLCMEAASVHERVFGDAAPRPAQLAERLALR